MQTMQQRLSRRPMPSDREADPKAAVEVSYVTQTRPIRATTATEQIVPVVKRAPPRPVPATLPVSVPAVPEEGADGDKMESAIRMLKGARPDLLRAATYYSGAKQLYGILATFPVLSAIAPTVEVATESFINMTPLKPSPEEAEKKSVSVIDKRISDALSYADKMVDSKKDETIEGVVAAKKAVGSLGPVQSAMGVACNLGDGVGHAYGSANQTVSGVLQQLWNTYAHVTSMAGSTVDSVTNTAGSAVSHVTGATGKAMDSAMSTAENTVWGVKSVVGTAADGVGSTLHWAVSTTVGLVRNVLSCPWQILRPRDGVAKAVPPPEE